MPSLCFRFFFYLFLKLTLYLVVRAVTTPFFFAGDDGCAGYTDDIRPHHARTQGDPILLKATRCEMVCKIFQIRREKQPSQINDF
jgi:hypothetical protein